MHHLIATLLATNGRVKDEYWLYNLATQMAAEIQPALDRIPVLEAEVAALKAQLEQTPVGVRSRRA